MGELLERIKISSLVNGSDISSVFKNNSLFFYEAYTKSDKMVTSIPRGKIQLGAFYFLHYKDDSNWMKWSPIFTVDVKKFDNLIILYGVNFNFIPLVIRSTIFDKFIIEDDFEKDRLLKVDFEGVYKELFKYGFEYAIVEYNLAQIERVHKINMEMVPRFLYSQHPKNKYDPKKLYSIWEAKIDDKIERHREISASLVKDFYQASDDIMGNYKQLESHINRLQKSLQKYG